MVPHFLPSYFIKTKAIKRELKEAEAAVGIIDDKLKNLPHEASALSQVGFLNPLKTIQEEAAIFDPESPRFLNASKVIVQAEIVRLTQLLEQTYELEYQDYLQSLIEQNLPIIEEAATEVLEAWEIYKEALIKFIVASTVNGNFISTSITYPFGEYSSSNLSYPLDILKAPKFNLSANKLQLSLEAEQAAIDEINSQVEQARLSRPSIQADNEP